MTATQGPARHVPQRMCVACRTATAKRGLIRVVRGERIEVDSTGKKPGRGAYLCAQRACWEAALKKERLEHALRTRLTPEDRQRLEEFARGLKDN